VAISVGRSRLSKLFWSPCLVSRSKLKRYRWRQIHLPVVLGNMYFGGRVNRSRKSGWRWKLYVLYY
jgi:hypothetical protein